MRAFRLLLCLLLPVSLGPVLNAQSLQLDTHALSTPDGLLLMSRRYRLTSGIATAPGGGQPVVLFHGLGANARSWDLPGPTPSLARYLAQRGYDVWLPNFRSQGQGLWQSQGAFEHSLDELAIYDVGTAIAGVQQETGERPLVVAHSMGGMALYGWLQGAVFQRVPVRVELRTAWVGFFPTVQPVTVMGRRVARDPAVAASRQARLKGVCTLSSPPFAGWPVQVTPWNFRQASYWEYNLLLEIAARHPIALRAYLPPDEVHFEALYALLTDTLDQLPFYGPYLQDFVDYVTGRFGTSFLAVQLANPDNLDPYTAVVGVDLASDSVATRVFRQFIDSVQTGSLRELHVRDPLRAPYVYSDHLDAIELPILVLAGDRDKVANDDHIEAFAFGRLGSADKSYLPIQGYGHIDIILGKEAAVEVFAPVEGWLRAHR